MYGLSPSLWSHEKQTLLFNIIITSLKALDESFSSRNHVRKFLRALLTKWRPKVTAIEESKDLSILPLDELINNLKVYEVVLEKDSEASKIKKEKYKSLALKARKISSDKEESCSGSDEEYAMAVRDLEKFFRRGKFVCQPYDEKKNLQKVKEEKKGKEERRCFKCGDPNHFASEFPKHSFNDQKAFVGGCWSDSEDGDDSKDVICLMALDNNEVRLKVKLEQDEWIKDSGCSRHIMGNKDLFSTYEAINGGNVVFGSNTKSKIIRKGQICDKKCKVLFSETGSEILKDGITIDRGIRKNGLYIMKMGNSPKDSLCLTSMDDISTLWHRRLGHANMRLIQSLSSKELVKNLPKLKFENHFCDACNIGKQVHEIHKAKNMKIQVQEGCPIVSIRTDHGREFDNEVQFRAFCDANGITHNFSAPRTPQSNELFKGVFLGYSPNSKAYIILNKKTIRIEESLNARFDEIPPPKSSPLVDDGIIESQIIENQIEDIEVKENEPLNKDIINIKESKDHMIETVIGNLNERTLRSQVQNQINFFCFISSVEPKNIKDESWTMTMQEELDQFVTNYVWSLVPPPNNQTVIGTKWVFKNKLDENGVVSRNKARRVAQGYNQQERIDFDETYVLVARLESIRILLAYACEHDFKLFQMDVKSAFLNGFINEEVYVSQPPGFVDFEKP
ncbi:retrovirus-related pol polyprotein from transposon TNT 1-94 [Tanacetum coccineum]